MIALYCLIEGNRLTWWHPHWTIPDLWIPCGEPGWQ